MKKCLFSVFVFVLVLAGSVLAYAGTSEEEKSLVEITSDFNFDSEKVSTFNDEKTISGTAPKGTVIEIVLSTKNYLGKFREREIYTIEVGTSELFSQAVELRLGENLIEFTAVLEQEEDVCQSTIVNRKNVSIKTKLENSIYLPGGLCK